MKKIILLFLLCFFAASVSLFAQIKVASNGNVGINNSNPGYKLDVAGNMRVVASGYTVYFSGSLLSPSYGSNVDLGSYSNIWNNLFARYAYFYYEPYIISDRRIKTNIKELPSVTDKISLLRPVTYTLNPDLPENTPAEIRDDILNKVQYGFIAQELQEIFPELVTEADDGLLSIQYAGLVPVLVKAFHEQQAEIDALNKRIEDLESRIR
jgi:hypothetical protein